MRTKLFFLLLALASQVFAQTLPVWTPIFTGGNGQGGGGGGPPGGSNTQVQFNDSGAFGGSSLFTFNKTTGATQIGGDLTLSGTNGTSGSGFLIGPSTAGKNLVLLNGNSTGEIVFRNSLGTAVGYYDEPTDLWTYVSPLTLGGTLTLQKSTVTTPTAQTYGATLTVNVTLPLTTVSLTGNCTETFSATPTTGTKIIREYTADSSTRTITPDNNSGNVYFNDLGTTASSFTVAANTTKTVIYERQSGRWAAYATGVSTVGTASTYVLGTSTFLFDTHGATWDGAGSVLTTGKAKGYWVCPYAATISGYNISVDTGTATFTVWKIAAGTAVPTVANLINTSGVAISSGTNLTSTTVSDFTTTAIAAGDILAFNLTAVASATQATFTIKLTKL